MSTKNEPTNVQKLDACIAELTILLPRLTDQYQPSVKTCIEYLKDVRADITPADDGLPGQFEECVHNVPHEDCGICSPKNPR